MKDLHYYYGAYGGQEADPLLLGGFFVTLMVLSLALYMLQAFLLGRVFKKAGVPQWVAWVPVYNMWKFLELGDQRGFWAVVYIVPPLSLVSVVFIGIAAFHIGKKLGKEGWFVLLALFVPIAWMIWLGFDDSRWHEKQTESHRPRKTSKKS